MRVHRVDLAVDKLHGAEARAEEAAIVRVPLALGQVIRLGVRPGAGAFGRAGLGPCGLRQPETVARPEGGDEVADGPAARAERGEDVRLVLGSVCLDEDRPHLGRCVSCIPTAHGKHVCLDEHRPHLRRCVWMDTDRTWEGASHAYRPHMKNMCVWMKTDRTWEGVSG